MDGNPKTPYVIVRIRVRGYGRQLGLAWLDFVGVGVGVRFPGLPGLPARLEEQLKQAGRPERFGVGVGWGGNSAGVKEVTGLRVRE
jgi:hypothetical protein